MITTSDLRMALIDLLYELRNSEIKPIIGGGFGIFLRVERVRTNNLPTLFTEWPEPRSTNDLDLFLRPELLINSEKLAPLAEILDHLGYQVIESARMTQFIKKPNAHSLRENEIKIDLLTGPRKTFENTKVEVQERRIKPQPSVNVHARPTDEAVTLEEGLLSYTLSANRTSGEPYEADIFLPHPFTFLMMKLFAFKDRFEDGKKDFARHHALDLYSIMATTIESEWNYALSLRDKWEDEPKVVEAGSIVTHYFSDQDQVGMLRLMESPYYRPSLQLNAFMSALTELFPKRE